MVISSSVTIALTKTMLGPRVSMIQTPKFLLVLVQSSYMERRPKVRGPHESHLHPLTKRQGSSQFTLFLESKIKKNMPRASAKQGREKLQFHMQCGEQVSEAHLRMFAHLLSFNPKLLDPVYSEEYQSHWSGISQATVKETKISFFVPCLRLRWRWVCLADTIQSEPESILYSQGSWKRSKPEFLSSVSPCSVVQDCYARPQTNVIASLTPENFS